MNEDKKKQQKQRIDRIIDEMMQRGRPSSEERREFMRLVRNGRFVDGDGTVGVRLDPHDAEFIYGALHVVLAKLAESIEDARDNGMPAPVADAMFEGIDHLHAVAHEFDPSG